MEDQSEREGTFTTKLDKVNSKVKTPKNVRQIGKIGDGLRIYVEDYVKTYTKQIAESDYTNRCIAVLAGEYRSNDQERNVFLYGAIKVEYDGQEEENIFTEAIWTTIYEKIKQYFPEAEIVGWYYGGTGLGSEDLPFLEKIQMNNFAGRDKVLLTYDALEKESNFYLFDGYAMILQPGYYIYYEKNEEMQNYMVDHKKVKQEEELVDDRAIHEMRTMMNEKKPVTSKGKEQKVMLRLSYAAGTLMLVVALIVGVTVYGNDRKMKEMEGDIQVMKSNIFDKDPEKEAESEKDEANMMDHLISQVSKEPVDPSISLSPTPKPSNENVTPEAKPTQKVSEEQGNSAVNTTNTDELTKYTVKEGDTLASICIKECGSYGKITQVKELNHIEDENVILVGQVLIIPKK